ncbi:MAG: hypothetical protein WCI11_11180 [Candidatus Methylumidiphilus sp.]
METVLMDAKKIPNPPTAAQTLDQARERLKTIRTESPQKCNSHSGFGFTLILSPTKKRAQRARFEGKK